MPELPEVETVRLGLAPIVGVPIERARVARRDVVRDEQERRRGRLEMASLFEHSWIAETRRHGKQLALIGANGRVVLIHLGMSGQLLLMEDRQRVAGGHAHVAWSFDNGRRLVFRDPRRFGGVWLITHENALDARWSRLGPDGLSVTARDLRAVLGGSKRALKAAILDQRAVAGVGNIYADEALFDAGLSPERRCDRVTQQEWARLAASVRRTLGAGLRSGGSTLRDYRRPDGSAGSASSTHRVYGRGGLACVRCGEVLAKTAIAQRTTVWCRVCQE